MNIYASDPALAPRPRTRYSDAMTDVTVISLGGSLIAPDAVDTGFLAAFHRLAVAHLEAEPAAEADRDLRRRRAGPPLPGRLPRAGPIGLERRPRLGRHRGHARQRRAGAARVRRARAASRRRDRPDRRATGSRDGSWSPRGGSPASRRTTTRSSSPGGSARARWSTCRTSRRCTPPIRRRTRRPGRWTRSRGRSSGRSSARSGRRAGTPRSIPRRRGPPPPRACG